MRVLDISWGILFEPSRTLRGAALDPPLWPAFLVFLLVSFVTTAASSLGGGSLQFMGLLSLSLMAGLLGWVLRTAVWRFLAELLGGQGSARALFTGSGLSQLPRIFLAPGALLSAALGWGPGLLVSLGVGLWVLALNALAVKETEGLSLPLSVVVVLAPYLVLMMAALMGLFLLVILAISSLLTLDPGALLILGA